MSHGSENLTEEVAEYHKVRHETVSPRNGHTNKSRRIAIAMDTLMWEGTFLLSPS